MIPLKIKGFALDEDTQMPIALLTEETGGRILPVCIGPFEASAIIIKLEGISPPRPLTHDSLTNLFIKHGFNLDRLEIYDRSVDYIYFARIKYHKGFKHFEMELRPSDGLALAVRLKVPILVDEKLLSRPMQFSPIIENVSSSSPRIMFLNTEQK